MLCHFRAYRPTFAPSMLLQRAETFLASRLDVRSAGAGLSFEDRHRGERVLASVRVFLAVILFLSALLHGAAAAPLFRLLVAGYLLFAGLVALVVRSRPSRWTVMTVMAHLTDLSTAAGLAVLTNAGTPFWMVAVFALLASAHRWGFRETIATAVLLVVLSAQAALAGMSWDSFDPGDLGGRASIGPVLLLVAGVLLAYFAHTEKQARTEAATLAAVMSRLDLRLGLKHTMGIVFDAVVRLLDADRALLVVRETSTGRVSLWEGGRLSGHSAQSLRVTPLDERGLESYMFAPAAAAWYAAARGAVGGRLDVMALDQDGLRIDRPAHRLPEALEAAVGPFRELMAVGFEMPGELTGRLFLVDPHAGRDRERALAFGQRIVRHIVPAVYNVYLLHRLRTRSASNERARVARELHDGIIQSVLGVQIQLHALSIPAAKTSQALASELNRLGTILRDETMTLRDMMRGLAPQDLAPEQLMETLADVVNRFQRETGITAELTGPFDRLDLPPRACREVIRIVQEVLVNVRKHSGARNVFVRLAVHDGRCQLSIDDDGRGFPYARSFSQAGAAQVHPRPRVIQERVRLLGGEVTVESAPARGARIAISFPLAANAIRG